ncbi:uncharacterized protein BO97DRAFT_443259 [Aspergillus homomorphus CBS 101889]|uniref:DUF3533 domain-containing protein n=1 Tax=Aspergillus homomorphus (strain CBS 101889) TaxID=1450537 RepID=A0A395HXN1_ASPHC|nr:hypothetical protein BO97DRAFT_443259 [Aspergillus homomorphus CBS 101889]RAL12239.1 hypothetical protein BO97DRAFT_443259 [Aspergillus homomorphus CBS 101889]
MTTAPARFSGKDDWKQNWRNFLAAVGVSFLLSQLLFLGDMSYLWSQLPYFTPSIPRPLRNSPGCAKRRLPWRLLGRHLRQPQEAQRGWQLSLAGNTDDNANNSTSTALTYIGNGARNPAFAQSAVYSHILTLLQATRSAYYARNASNMLQTLALVHAIHTNHLPQPDHRDGFFFMMALNGLSAQFQLFTRLTPRANRLLRLCISFCYIFIGALWAFRESWSVTANRPVLCWMAVWLDMHINFQIVDVLTAYVPMQFMPFCILPWAIVSVASTVSPFEMQPGFFRWGYALPAHELYQVLVQIWSHGCESQLRTALPVLFSWWVVSAGSGIAATHRRCRIAVAAATHGEKSFEGVGRRDGKAESVRTGSSTQGILRREVEGRQDTVELARLENAGVWE